MVNSNDPKTWGQVKIFDGMPNYANEVINGMTIIYHKKSSSFIDMFGNNVEMPLNDTRLYYAEGYYRAAWDLRMSNLRLSENGETLYRRNPDMSGNLKKLQSWHEVASIENEYGIPSGRQRIRSWDMLIMNEAEKNPRVRKGMRFGSQYACYRENQQVVFKTLPALDDTAFVFHDNSELPESETIRWMIRNAQHWVEWLTADQHSAENLLRMFATPFLEPYKHLTYVLYGGGGNGKGILLGRMARQYPEYASTFNTKRFADGKGFIAEQESRKIIGKYWLFDEEADILDQESMTQIKRLSTGEPVAARKIGENAISIKPKATLVIATNEPFISSQAEASTRRFTFIRMKEGRTANDFQEFMNFLDQHGIVPFLIASCKLWAKTDDPWTDVSIGGENDMTDSEEWVRDVICTQGYAVSSENPYGKRFSITSRNKLGLSSIVKWVDGKTKRVLAVNDERRFAPYRRIFEENMNAVSQEEHDQHQNEKQEVPDPIIVKTAKQTDPLTYGFVCKLAPAIARGENQKKSFVWASYKDNSQDLKDREKILNHQRAYAVVPDKGYAIIDMDRSQTSEDGWNIICQQVGSYGSADFPKTYLVKTPSGGVHAYYKIPKGYSGKLKNAAHPNGIPVDTRVERKGYVIGAMSLIDNGEYSLCDLPENGHIPEMPKRMIAWLKQHDYIETTDNSAARNFTIPKNDDEGNGNPDMSKIPEGQRNSELHDWAFGRLANHPGNSEQIKADLFDRGRLSGLHDSELETIWRSICRKVNNSTR